MGLAGSREVVGQKVKRETTTKTKAKCKHVSYEMLIWTLSRPHEENFPVEWVQSINKCSLTTFWASEQVFVRKLVHAYEADSGRSCNTGRRIPTESMTKYVSILCSK